MWMRLKQVQLHGRSISSLASNPPHQLPWLFLGLGNPGLKFQGTRHNVGFEMIDVLSEKLGISVTDVHCKALFGQGFVGDVPVFLAKPQTYMNLSGESTGPLAAYYKLPLNRVIVFHDDMELQCGVLRLQPQGGHFRHNGINVGNELLKVSHNVLKVTSARSRADFVNTFSSFNVVDSRLKSVIDHFRGNREFNRLRIGIGRPPGQMDPKAFLLQKFSNLARERIDAALTEGADVLKLIPSEGFAECARRFNSEQKYKHIRPPDIFRSCEQ